MATSPQRAPLRAGLNADLSTMDAVVQKRMPHEQLQKVPITLSGRSVVLVRELQAMIGNTLR